MKMINKNDKSLNQRGNAMVYVLVALALFGFLTVTLSSQNDQADGQDLDDEMAALYAQELIGYAAAAQNSVDLMLASGSEIDDLDFVNPSSAAFNTPPHYNKVFHPQGGGLNYQETFSSSIVNNPTTAGWFIVNNLNIEWTPTTAPEVVLSALRIKKEICEIINEKITGSKNITSLAISGLDGPFEIGGTPLNVANCSACEGYPSLCVANAATTNYGFYSIIAAQ